MSKNPEPVPQSRRLFLSLLTGGSISAATLGALYPAIAYFIPPAGSGGGAGVAARDKEGKTVVVSALLDKVPAGDRIISQGPTVNNGTATYIVVDDTKQIANFGLNAVCPHLGCVVPWDQGAGKFVCPCHGSEYTKEGGLAKGPAPYPLALVKAEVKGEEVVFSPWEGDDFRKTDLYSNPKPWWV